MGEGGGGREKKRKRDRERGEECQSARSQLHCQIQHVTNKYQGLIDEPLSVPY